VDAAAASYSKVEGRREASRTPDVIAALEAVKRYTVALDLPSRQLKNCIACFLDGNLGGAGRHEAAFCIAIELRRMELPEGRAREVVEAWARDIGYSSRDAVRGVTSAYRRDNRGNWKYWPPGLHKAGQRYRHALKPLCDALGCPTSCLPFADQFAGPRGQDFLVFEQLGWPRYLNRLRQRASVDVYRVLCNLEKTRGFAEGARFYTHYRQLAERAHIDPTTAGRALRQLRSRQLIEFEPGSGSGPRAADRKASRVRRVIPIPKPPIY
jgi:hypothetical protein